MRKKENSSLKHKHVRSIDIGSGTPNDGESNTNLINVNPNTKAKIELVNSFTKKIKNVMKPPKMVYKSQIKSKTTGLIK